MERQLNNPLRPSLRQNPGDREEAKIQQPTETNNLHQPKAPVKNRQIIETPSIKHPISPEVNKALDQLNVPIEFRNLVMQLADKGIELSTSKKNFVKHSYEIEESLHKRFHEMYSVLGFKKVKDAINDAISNWCDLHASEFERRNGKQK